MLAIAPLRRDKLAERGTMSVRERDFVWGARTYIMGIVNVTPDSFSGDGICDAQGAIDHAIRQWEQGADILDIGGESTRPGHRVIDEAEELARVIPVVRGVRERLPGAPISIDTHKPVVARAARAAGADIVNCVWGAPELLLEVAAEYAMPLVAMHNHSGTAYDGNVVDVVTAFLRDAATRADARGVRVILDPGIGFGKTPEQNIEMLKNLVAVADLGYPTLLGTSRKSTIGRLTGREPQQRVAGTLASTALAIAAGIDIVRVHDVTETRDAVAVSDAIVRGWRPQSWTE